MIDEIRRGKDWLKVGNSIGKYEGRLRLGITAGLNISMKSRWIIGTDVGWI